MREREREMTTDITTMDPVSLVSRTAQPYLSQLCLSLSLSELQPSLPILQLYASLCLSHIMLFEYFLLWSCVMFKLKYFIFGLACIMFMNLSRLEYFLLVI
jgi:hypothetical protein